jgi:DNA-binding transcriptional LysR family regulator
VRLSVPRAVVPILLEPLIASFAKAYPEIKVEIAASEKLVDLAAIKQADRLLWNRSYWGMSPWT